MKKRFLFLLLIALALLALLPTAALAKDPTVISEVRASIEVPIVGMDMDYSPVFPSDEHYKGWQYTNGIYRNGVCWQEEESSSYFYPGNSFSAGKSYMVEIDVQADEGYRFADYQNMTATINGKHANVAYDGEILEITCYFNPLNRIDYAYLTVAAPIAGKKPAYEVTYSTKEPYSLVTETGGGTKNGVTWYRRTGSGDVALDPATAKFENGGVYTVSFCLAAKEYYAISEWNTSVLVNGEEAETEQEGELLRVRYTFPAVEEKKLITSVSVEIQEPAVDARPDYTVSGIPTDAHYFSGRERDAEPDVADNYLNDVGWSKDLGGGNEMSFLRHGTDFFEPGVVYTVWIYLTAKDGYTFADEGNLSVTMNDRVLTRFQTMNGGTRLVLLYNFPRTPASKEGWSKLANGKWIYVKDGERQIGWVKVSGKWYYLDGDGYMCVGWQEDGGRVYYLKATGEMAAGETLTIDGQNCVFHADGRLRSGFVRCAEGRYYCENYAAVKNCWKQFGGKWYYFGANRNACTGWLGGAGISGTYYLGTDCAMVTGWQKIEGLWYYFAADGRLQTGWQKIDGKWYYLSDDMNTQPGWMVTGWKEIGGKWYYLKSEMKTGWQQISGYWYYLGADGAMRTGWQQVSGKWYYLGTNGAMRTGWAQVNGKWYYLGTDGAMKTGWAQVSGYWYYLGADGAMRTGWQQIAGKWYYLGTNGAMVTGWLQQNGKWYYLKTDGSMAASETLTIDGKRYRFNASGVWVS